MHPLKNILNKLFWDQREDPGDYRVKFVHRGVPDNVKVIPASQIVEVGNSSFVYSSEDETKTTIPFHRIIEVANIVSAKTLWKSRKLYSKQVVLESDSFADQCPK